ncbi:MAG TPA: pitrilysin family protein [Candidatus Paceibacterota bacterium]|nr:pitrilysin family protein [Candidatus Paceibacterota bacterium]HMP19208.1 pitrilysin family protein [Candidatus Paceibacterota bacterium]HMP85350.1 pitrilysin family protein [Candidatus Paceibacterota bacterium]
MKYTKKKLSNGLRVITVPMKESQTAIMMVLVETGAEYEDRATNGLSHFLEHMCFKGTKNRTLDQIATELDSMGAENNAFTGETYTGYFAKAEHSKIKKIIDIISDLYINPTFPEKDIDIERGVILEEMNMYEDLHMRKVFDLYNELLFGDQPAGRTIIGTKENIKKFSRDDFVKYYQTHYIPQKTTVVVAGKIKEGEIWKEIKKKFGNLKKQKIIKKPKTNFSQNKPEIKIKYRDIDQTHMIVGFRSFDLYDKRNPALSLASTILSGGMSSRLFKKMRDELGLCYYVKSSNSASVDHGNFYVRIGVGNHRAVEAISVLMQEFKKIRDEKITDIEFQKAKDIVVGAFANGLETSDSWAMYYGDQELFHQKIQTPEQYIKKINALTPQKVQKVLKEIFKKENLNLAIIGPQKDYTVFEEVLKI